MFTISLTIFIVSIVLTGYLYLIWNFGYWKKRDVKEARSKALVGSFPNSISQKKKVIYDMHDIYNEFKNDENFVGVYMVRHPQLLILNASLAHEVFVTKFKYFHDNAHSVWIQKDAAEIGNNPFFLRGDEWKEKRSEISPGLTASRIKASYPIIQQICGKMTTYIKMLLVKTNKECNNIDVKELISRFTAQSVSACIYESDACCFTEENNQTLRESKFMSSIFFNNLSIKFLASSIPLTKFFLKPKYMTATTAKFVTHLLRSAIEIRQNSKFDVDDYLNFLLELKEKKKLTLSEMITYSLPFFAGGFETSATLISHCLLSLARNISAQQQLRKEILSNLGDDDTISFDKLHGMEYLDQCFQETLRIFTPIQYLTKICTEPVELENTRGRKLKLNVGEVINIPVHSFHHDEKYFPNPEEFIPERFSKENGGAKKYRNEGKFLPFGDGPRMCLGYRFALTQSKAAVCEIIKKFDITPNEKTRTDNYLSAQTVIASLDGGIWLNFKEINH